MKKTYISPDTQLHQVELQRMIAASQTSFTFNGDGTGSGTLNNDDATGDAMSRQGDLWDEE